LEARQVTGDGRFFRWAGGQRDAGLLPVRRMERGLVGLSGLARREANRSREEREIRFLYRVSPSVIPAWVNGELGIYDWGNLDSKDSCLPKTGWCRRENLEESRWNWLKPESVTIPAALGTENGRWFQIYEGIRGILVRDSRNRPHVYMLTEDASHYYHIMTG
jgi:hypothetical protein